MKNKETLKKIAKRVAIVGGLCVLADTCYSMGKGQILNSFLEYDVDAKDVYKLLENYNDPNLIKRMRVKFIKFIAKPTEFES